MVIIKIALEEADESNFWLTFIADVGLRKKDHEELNFLINESEESIAIFTALVKTISKSKEQKS